MCNIKELQTLVLAPGQMNTEHTVVFACLLVVRCGVFGVVEQVVDPGDGEQNATLPWVPLAVYVWWHVSNGGGGGVRSV